MRLVLVVPKRERGCYSLEHVSSDSGNSCPGAGSGGSRSLLEAGLDGIDGGVAQRTHGTRDEANDGGLPAGKGSALVLGLPDLQPLLEVAVGGEVDGLVRTLSERSQRDTTVQSAETFLLDDGVESVGGVAVLGDVEGIGHGVVLGLETNLDNFHGGNDGDGFSHTGSETSDEDGLAGDNAGLGIREDLLVPLERGETNGHLGNDTGQNGTQTLVETERCLLAHNVGARLDEAASRSSGLTRSSGELHSDLDCV